jgi:hypothetical protein
MVSKPRSWLRFPPATQFSTINIPPSLASAGPTRTVALEPGNTNSRGSHAGGGMLDYSIKGPLAPSISPGLYGWTG